MVCLYVKTRWNSTYLMLCNADKYEKAFELLGEEDYQFVVPSIIDWENDRAFVKFLKTFYDAMLKFLGSNCVTSNSYFIQLCIIQHTLNDGCLSCDPIMRSVSLSMKEKYTKYWGDIENNTNINFLMFVAFVQELLSKVRALTYWLIKCHGPKRAEAIVKIVKSLIKRLMDQYNKFNAGESSTIQANVGSSSGNLNVGCDVLEDSNYQFRKMFSQHIEEEDDLACRSEMDRGHVLDCFRSSLSLLTIEALICTHNWIKNSLSDAELEEFLTEFDELGKCL
ncbi:zinc finger BED domain-containing protein RICESLEEPER 1-like [Corylus avellana]|uniref:zinc finger BED domain-containing protein RICESLEEPER 1-like n=1 Tax=Corylus avellana TaxID=13451 RepID=UPI00286D2AE7|nr:zinc finger BED domain-containing protein RICESLEEPER 1-like [Corylus avellana]